MSFLDGLKHIGHSIEHAGSTIGHGVENAGKTIIHGTENAGTAIAKGVTDAGQTIGHVFTKGVDAAGNEFQKIETTIGGVVVSGAKDVEKGVDTAATTIGHGGSEAFTAAVNSGKEAFDAAKSEVEKAVSAGEAAILGPAAEHRVKALASEINTIKSTWDMVSSTLSKEIDVIRQAALSKQVTSESEAAFKTVSEKLAPAIATFFSKDYVSFGIEFGASAAFGIAGEAAVGLLAGLPNITDVKGYGSVGVTAGVEEGAEADIALVFNLSAPEDSGGPSANVVVSLEVEVGGTVVVSYNLPDFSFGGISIGLGGGEEVGVSVGAGYSYIF